MAHLDEFLAPVRQLSRDAFATQHAMPFLVVARDKPSAEPEWSFKTQTVSSARASLALLNDEGFMLAPEVSNYEVIAVVKTQSNPWRDRVSLGRARNNDIVLLDGSVSKLHAHFTLESSGSVTITDAGSRNGTKVNKRRLNNGEPTLLKSGDSVSVGRIEMVFLNAEGFHDFVTKHIQKRAAQ